MKTLVKEEVKIGPLFESASFYIEQNAEVLNGIKVFISFMMISISVK